MTDHLFDVHFGDEIIYGKLRGVRFWTYHYQRQAWVDQFIDPSYEPPCIITSFQYHDIDWSPGQVAQSKGDLPTIKNGRGLNVYKTVADALRGSADAINGVLRDNGAEIGAWSWQRSRRGIVLGEVEFWGPMVEHEHGYRAQYVQPTKFLRAWGYQPERSYAILNAIWFGVKS